MPPAATSEQNQLPGRPQGSPLLYTKRLAPSPCMVGAGDPVWGTGNVPALGAALVTKFIDEWMSALVPSQRAIQDACL